MFLVVREPTPVFGPSVMVQVALRLAFIVVEALTVPEVTVQGLLGQQQLPTPANVGVRPTVRGEAKI
jgi:hypothetical protein